MIMPYLYDLINDHRIARRVWKIQINMHVNFISSRDTGEIRTIYTWSNKVSIMQGIDTNDIIKELFESFLHDYQEKLKTIKGRDFVFESVYLMDYKLHRVRLKRGGSYIKSPEWLENKKAIRNPKNENDDECFQWSTICTLNYDEIMKKSLKTYLETLNMKINIFHHRKGTGKILNKKIMNYLLLIFYLHHKIVKKYRLYKNQNTI